MSLYEGIDFDASSGYPKPETNNWSSQLFLQTQLHLKKSQISNKPKKGFQGKHIIAPEINKEPLTPLNTNNTIHRDKELEEFLPFVNNEYDPRFPNDYDRVMSIREEERERERAEDWRKELEERDKKRREILEKNSRLLHGPNAKNSDAEDFGFRSAYSVGSGGTTKSAGTAIAPPPSVLSDVNAIIMGDADDKELVYDDDGNIDETKRGSQTPTKKSGQFAPALHGSVAAKIMAKYGFKHGQGLGKSEQGMSRALQVEKTSKRGGKIVHEKDLFAVTHKQNQNLESLSQLYGGLEGDEGGNVAAQLSPSLTFDQEEQLIDDSQKSIGGQNEPHAEENTTKPDSENTKRIIPAEPTQIRSNDEPQVSVLNPPAPAHQENIQAFKTPSKVVLLRNMVSPGEVDADLEIETREECSKYGEVKSCTVFEIPSNFFDKDKHKGDSISELDRVRIFVEFVRIESAVKAVIDLNGRFFGGRIVKADYYNLDRYRTYDLGEGI